ncbi:MAG: Arc family DNA-binding protein [Sulfuritalea sp.]|nr:Arc family DNA-binding protein [Sulfuritalea sp.]
MADLTIRGLPDELHRYLKQQAEANHRSINRETIALIERAMKGAAEGKPRLSAAEVIAKASRFAALPVCDGRSAAEMIEYDADGLPK